MGAVDSCVVCSVVLLLLELVLAVFVCVVVAAAPAGPWHMQWPWQRQDAAMQAEQCTVLYCSVAALGKLCIHAQHAGCAQSVDHHMKHRFLSTLLYCFAASRLACCHRHRGWPRPSV